MSDELLSENDTSLFSFSFGILPCFENFEVFLYFQIAGLEKSKISSFEGPVLPLRDESVPLADTLKKLFGLDVDPVLIFKAVCCS